MNDKRMLKLVKIKDALKTHLPSSIQLYNIIVCEISQDGGMKDGSIDRKMKEGGFVKVNMR